MKKIFEWFKFHEEYDSFWYDIGRPVFSWFIVIMAIITSLYWYSSCRQANIFNRINGTNYSCGDFFWAADQINAQTQIIHLIK